MTKKELETEFSEEKLLDEMTIDSRPELTTQLGEFYGPGYFFEKKEQIEKIIYDSLSKEVLELFSLFESAGYDLYIVGGYVRDFFCNCDNESSSHDIDFTTNATPEQIYTLIENTNYQIIDTTGIKYGTCRVHNNGTTYEISTYRKDGNYSDGRRPDEVTYSQTLDEDLSRRDFTMNTLCYSPKGGVYDLFHVLTPEEDLQIHELNTVGEPIERFKEDGLRILRAIRLAYEKEVFIDKYTEEGILEALKRGYLKNISSERIGDELQRIFRVFLPSQLAGWWDVSDPYLLEEILLLVIPNFEHNYRARIMIEESKEYHSELFWWWLITNTTPPQERDQLLNGFNLKKDLKNSIKHINNTWIGDWTAEYTFELDDFILVKEVLNECRTKEERDCIIKEILPLFYPECEDLKKEFERVIENGEPIYLSELAINGNDIKDNIIPKCIDWFRKNTTISEQELMEFKFETEIGELLLETQYAVWDNPLLNEKQTLLDYLWNEEIEPELEDRFLE